MGEFGAVAVVSGQDSRRTDTMPLHIEALSRRYSTAAFAVASVLALLALVTLVVKSLVEWQVAQASWPAAEFESQTPRPQTHEDHDHEHRRAAISKIVRRISRPCGTSASRWPAANWWPCWGPRASGKTTLLRIIAGLEQPDPGSGPILFQHENVADRDAANRQVGFVFQHYALFRHMTVFENVAFGLRVRPRRQRPPRSLIKYKVMRLLKLVQLEHYANRYPNQLSGGQRQRVALARALAIEPQVLLLDEPFGALDAQVRQELRQWLRRLHDEIHLTSVFVTHDQDEALELADRVLVMNAGRIEQIGTPDEVFHHPAHRVRGEVPRPGQPLPRPAGERQGPLRQHVAGLARARRPRRAGRCGSSSAPTTSMSTPSRNGHPCFRAVVTRIHSAGANVRVELLAESGERLHAELTQERYRALRIYDRQPGLRHAPRGEGLLQRGVSGRQACRACGSHIALRPVTYAFEGGPRQFAPAGPPRAESVTCAIPLT